MESSVRVFSFFREVFVLFSFNLCPPEGSILSLSIQCLAGFWGLVGITVRVEIRCEKDVVWRAREPFGRLGNAGFGAFEIHLKQARWPPDLVRLTCKFGQGDRQTERVFEGHRIHGHRPDRGRAGPSRRRGPRG